MRPTIHLFLQPRRHLYYTKGPPSHPKIAAYILAAAAAFATSIIIVFAAYHVSILAGSVAMRCMLSMALVVGGIGIVCVFSFYIKHYWWILCRRFGRTKCLIALMLCGAMVLLVLASSKTWSLIQTGFLWLAGIIPLLAIVVACRLADRSKDDLFVDKPAKPLSSGYRPCKRVVLLIFDELDQRVAFSERPAGLLLPWMDRFLSEAVVCTSAYPPSNCTEISIPAFLTGRLVEETYVSGPVSIGLRFSGASTYRAFGEQTTLFHRLRERSINCGVVVSYHPIGRLFGDVTADYLWLEGLTQESAIDGSIPEMIGAFLRSLLETPKYSLFGSSLIVGMGATQYLQSSAAAIRFASDPAIGVSFLHWTIPHAPYIYDRKRKALGRTTMGPLGYLDNLALCDCAMERVRTAMMAAGLWEQSVVIMTSDHWWRYASGLDGKMDRRVPFAVRFPGGDHGKYEMPFNTVALHDLTLAIVDNLVSSPTELLAWLRRNAVDAPPTKV